MKEKNAFSDSYLVRQFLDGDEEAFAEIVERHQKKVFYLSLKYLKNEEAAKDVAQETFVKLFRSLKSFQGRSDLFTYIYRIAINTCKNYIKKESRQNTSSLIESGEIRVSTNKSPSRILRSKQDLAKVWDIVDALPEKQRTAFMLRAIEDCSFKQVAEIMKSSLNAALVNYHFAVKKILKEFKESEE